MAKITLKSKERNITGRKVKKYRKDGLIPAVLYGHKIKSQNLWIDFLAFEKVYKQAGENTIIEIETDDGKKINALIQEVQVNPVKGNFSHIDFFQIKMDEKIEAEIPLAFVGESPAVKEMAGILVKNMDEIPVSCLPGDLPKEFIVDISKLKTFEDHIKISDLDISEKVKVMIEMSSIVASVAPPRSEEELTGLDEKVEEDVSKVEGVADKVPEESGEAAEAPETAKKEKPEGEKK
jgi:large subunit ribosomal protein L25